MKDYLLELLKTLESKVTPPVGCHHSITYNQYGSDEDGWEDKLSINVWLGNESHCIFLEQEDLDLPVNLLVIEIQLLLL